MVVNTTRVTVHPDKRQEFLQTIGRMMDPIKQARGCLSCRFYIDAVDENSSLILGEWETEIDLNNYMHSNEFAALRGAIIVLGVSWTDIKAQIYLVKGEP